MCSFHKYILSQWEDHFLLNLPWQLRTNNQQAAWSSFAESVLSWISKHHASRPKPHPDPIRSSVRLWQKEYEAQMRENRVSANCRFALSWVPQAWLKMIYYSLQKWNVLEIFDVGVATVCSSNGKDDLWYILHTSRDWPGRWLELELLKTDQSWWLHSDYCGNNYTLGPHVDVFSG